MNLDDAMPFYERRDRLEGKYQEPRDDSQEDPAAQSTGPDPRSAIERASGHLAARLCGVWALARHEANPTLWAWQQIHATVTATTAAIRAIPEIIPSWRFGRETADLLSSLEDELHTLLGVVLWNLAKAQRLEQRANERS